MRFIGFSAGTPVINKMGINASGFKQREFLGQPKKVR